jgi:hypothetical protein
MENCSGGQIREDEWGGACNAYGEKRNAHKILMENLKGRDHNGRPRNRWEAIRIKIDPIA